MTPDPSSLHGRLSRQPGSFGSLLDQVRRIEALDQALRRWTNEPWLDSIRVANLRGDTLVLFVDNAAAATTLRYRREALQAYLCDRCGVAISEIEAKVRPGRT